MKKHTTTSKLGRLLIVDDETELLVALCESLADQNYGTVGAPNAEEGLRRLQSDRFDLVITDLMMSTIRRGWSKLRKGARFSSMKSR